MDIEDLNAKLDQLRTRIDSHITEDQIARFKSLDAKHRAYHWREGKKTKGPKPTLNETQEYRESLPIRLRAAKPAESRVFLAEYDTDDNNENNNADHYFDIFEKCYTDIHTYQYAWIGMIMSDLQHKVASLYAIRSMLVYANALLMRHHSGKALCVLRVCEKAVDELCVTMREETGDDRFDLSYQEYKVHFYISMSLAELGRKEDSIEYFRLAASDEQLHRLQGMMEYRDRTLHDDEDVVESFDHTVSVLQEISKTLGIPRLHLDDSFYSENDEKDIDEEDFGLSAIEKLEDEQIWRCIESLGFGLNNGDQKTMDCCSYCWTRRESSVKTNVCSRCKAVSYCNKECQRNDWKDHKEDCIPVQNVGQATGCLEH